MQTYTVRLTGTENTQAAIGGCAPGDTLKIYGDRADEKYWLVADEADAELGTLPRSGKLMTALSRGDAMVRATVDRIEDHTTGDLRIYVSVLAGPPEDAPEYLAGLLALVGTADHDKPAAKVYKVGIVGEANYQPAIGRCSVGEQVLIAHEVGNPYDDDALVVVSKADEPIGYISKEHWLQDAIHEEGKGCGAQIRSIADGGAGALGVVLTVSICAGPVATRTFARVASPAMLPRPALSRVSTTAQPIASPARTGLIARIFGRL